MATAAIIEFDVETGRREISAAYNAYKQRAEPLGLKFGEVLCEWRDKFKSKGGHGSKGKGLVQHLDELSIPRSTAYHWMSEYEISVGIKERPADDPADDSIDLPPLTGYIKHDNHLRGEYLRGLGLPYPYCVEGKVIVPFQTHDVVLTALINEECRLASLCGCDDACCDRSHTQACGKRSDDYFRMFMEVESRICREADRKREDARREVEDGEEMTQEQRKAFDERYDLEREQEREETFTTLLKETGCIECYGHGGKYANV